MKWIKTSERLPDKEGEYFAMQTSEPNGNLHKTVRYFDPYNFQVVNLWEKLIVEWLDESEEIEEIKPDINGIWQKSKEKITDTQRLDWLSDKVFYNRNFEDNIPLISLNINEGIGIILRDYIDKQIKK